MGYMLSKDQENLPLKEARYLGYDALENLMAKAAAAAADAAPKENKVGSFERLAGWAANGMSKRV